MYMQKCVCVCMQKCVWVCECKVCGCVYACVYACILAEEWRQELRDLTGYDPTKFEDSGEALETSLSKVRMHTLMDACTHR